MKQTHIVTRESLIDLLKNDTRRAEVIGRALVVLFNNQTSSEKAANVTNLNNSIGFTGADGHSGCLSAKYFLKHKTLLPWQVDRWMKLGSSGFPRITKYWRQLDAAAQAKRAQSQTLESCHEAQMAQYT